MRSLLILVLCFLPLAALGKVLEHHHHHHRLACKEDYRYAISSTDEIGLLGAGGLTTTWKEYNHDLQLNDGTVKASCVAGSFKVTALNVVSRRYLASLHKKALPTSVTFELLFDGTNPATEEMGDDFRSGLCPFDTSPVVKGKYNTALLNGAAFYLVCPIGWTGVIECTAVSPTTLRTEVVKTFRRDKPFPHRMDCVTTTVENEDLGSGGGGSGGGGSGSAHIVMVDAYKPTK
nr:cSIG-E2-Spy [synthetic construct]